MTGLIFFCRRLDRVFILGEYRTFRWATAAVFCCDPQLKWWTHSGTVDRDAVPGDPLWQRWVQLSVWSSDAVSGIYNVFINFFLYFLRIDLRQIQQIRASAESFVAGIQQQSLMSKLARRCIFIPEKKKKKIWNWLLDGWLLLPIECVKAK